MQRGGTFLHGCQILNPRIIQKVSGEYSENGYQINVTSRRDVVLFPPIPP